MFWRRCLLQIVAYVLIQAEPDKAWAIAEEASKLEGVKMVHTVTGLYDIIAYAEMESLEALKDLITRIHTIKGIQRTHTAISV